MSKPTQRARDAVAAARQRVIERHARLAEKREMQRRAVFEAQHRDALEKRLAEGEAFGRPLAPSLTDRGNANFPIGDKRRPEWPESRRVVADLPERVARIGVVRGEATLRVWDALRAEGRATSTMLAERTGMKTKHVANILARLREADMAHVVGLVGPRKPHAVWVAGAKVAA